MTDLSSPPIDTQSTNGSSQLYSVIFNGVERPLTEIASVALRQSPERFHALSTLSVQRGRTVDIGFDTAQIVSSSTIVGYSDGIPVDQLGWTMEEAREIRESFSVWAEDWDDSDLDAYNVYLQG